MKTTSTERSRKKRMITKARKVLLYQYENNDVPELESMTVYLDALQAKYKHEIGLENATISNEWRKLFLEYLNEHCDSDTDIYELQLLGTAHRYADDKWKNDTHN